MDMRGSAPFGDRTVRDLADHIPTLETRRLILRAPRMTDMEPFAAFLGSDRAAFVGGPVTDNGTVIRAFGHIAGLWVLRGYSCFVAEKKGTPGGIGLFGLWYPVTWPEAEMSWSIWDARAEGHGYAAEAMRAVMPWSFRRAGIASAISVIDAANHASRRLAETLGAVIDASATLAANSPDSPFFEADEDHVVVYRHRSAA